MRKKIVAGNWKMNLNLDEAMALVSELKVKIDHQLNTGAGEYGKTMPEIVLFPPFVYLTRVIEVFRNYKNVSLGSQNVHHEEKGAYTGEVSAMMVRSLGAAHALIGHSERRSQFGEDDDLLATKIKLAFKHGLTPVYCCGEMLPERESGKHFEIVKSQIQRGVFWMDEDLMKKVIVAYEPVWAIGTGHTATPEQAREMHAFIRKLISDKYSAQTADMIPILYGGSCNAKNAAELFKQPDVDGGLIGGASLKAQDFFQIIQSF